MKRFSLFQIAAFVAIGLAAFNPVLKADEYNRKTVITISQPLEVPGVVLPPGTYVMKLFNSSSNRHIVQFTTEDQKQQLALTFAVPAERTERPEKTLLTMYEGTRDAPPALRTWFYPGDTIGQEFLYPHNQAVRISQRTNTQVPEVETAAVTPAAEPAQSKASPGESVLIARAEPAPEPIPAPAPAAAQEPQQPANDAQPAQSAATTADSLPQTAGNGPLAALIGGLSVLFALGLRTLRRGTL